ncbi:MAG: hypothetical protein ABI361_06075 [Nitrososphaera sp.]|jgi:hypothetical protein
MNHLNYFALIGGMIVTILVFAYYIVPEVICTPVVERYNGTGSASQADPVLQVCLVEKGR